MSFINAVICGGPGVNLDFRLHMRWEFIRLGLIQLIDVLFFDEKIGNIENELLQTQIDVWIAGMEADEAELFGNLDVKKFNTDDAVEIAKALNSTMKYSSCGSAFTSLLRHLTVLPAHSFERMKYMLVIDKLVQQLSIQKHGEDPDPSVVLANIDVRDFVGQMDNVETLKEQEQRYQKQLEKARRLEKELEAIKDESGSANVGKKLAEAQSKINDLERKLTIQSVFGIN